MPSVVTPERFASGMTFDQYATFIGTSENLAREATNHAMPRRDYSAFFREAFDKARLNEPQMAALHWLCAQPGGPAKMLVLSEDWSSDCRRDVPMFARMAFEARMELRIFPRDGKLWSDSHSPSKAEAPDSNADIMAKFLNHKNGDTWQSIPVAVFYTDGLEYLYHYQEYPAIYNKDALQAQFRVAQPGESPEAAAARFARDFQALQDSAWFRIWQCAAVDEMLSALQRRLLLGRA